MSLAMAVQRDSKTFLESSDLTVQTLKLFKKDEIFLKNKWFLKSGYFLKTDKKKADKQTNKQTNAFLLF